MRSSAIVSGTSIMGKVSHKPVKPTVRVIGKPMVNTFIWGDTRAQALARTRDLRPDLIEARGGLGPEDLRLLAEFDL